MIQAADNVILFTDNVSEAEFKKANPGIPWDSIIKMRHILVHGYAEVLPEIMWNTAVHDIPELREKLLALR